MAIPAGTVQMGDTGQYVQLDSFWMSATELPYDLYLRFETKAKDNNTHSLDSAYSVDAVTRPSPQYMDYADGMGRRGGYPAVGMTQQAALRYCHWLYKKTGVFYRLPTEAEWEYACKANLGRSYDIDLYAWHWDNSGEAYHKAGEKKANAWGLYDMLGNVWEYTLDEYREDIYPNAQDTLSNPVNEPLSRYFRVVKGGGYDDDPEECSCINRMKASPTWQQRDPQIPKSEWWNPDSPFLGFRIVQPIQQPSSSEVDAFFARFIRYTDND